MDCPRTDLVCLPPVRRPRGHCQTTVGHRVAGVDADWSLDSRLTGAAGANLKTAKALGRNDPPSIQLLLPWHAAAEDTLSRIQASTDSFSRCGCFCPRPQTVASRSVAERGQVDRIVERDPEH